VAGTLTALAPSPTATQSPSPTRTPTATATASPSQTLTATSTPSPTEPPTQTLSVEEQVRLTLTQYYIDQMTLQVWVEREGGATHPWHRQLPDEIRASSWSEAELVVKIEEKRVYVDSANYYYQPFGGFACTMKRYRIDNVSRLVDTRDSSELSTRTFRGSQPSFPQTTFNCSDLIGDPPSFSQRFVDWLAPSAYLLGTPTPTPRPSPTPRIPTATPPPDADFKPHERYVHTGPLIEAVR